MRAARRAEGVALVALFLLCGTNVVNASNLVLYIRSWLLCVRDVVIVTSVRLWLWFGLWIWLPLRNALWIRGMRTIRWLRLEWAPGAVRVA